MVAAARRVLIFNRGSGSLTAEARTRLLNAFSDHTPVAVEPGQDLEEAYGSCVTTDDAQVVVAGGDGTVEAIARCLAGTSRRLGLIPLGTYNNFARALALPLELDGAVEVVKTGRARRVTIGWVEDRPFLEAATIGVFGDMLEFGEAAKELHYGQLLGRIVKLARPESFQYVIRGDVHLTGEAASLVFANTPTIGALMELAHTTPEDPYLELEVISHGARRRVLKRLLLAVVRRGDRPGKRVRVRDVRVATEPPVSVYADAFEAGESPVSIRADARGLNVILPAK